jgi:hypothetical protein
LALQACEFHQSSPRKDPVLSAGPRFEPLCAQRRYQRLTSIFGRGCFPEVHIGKRMGSKPTFPPAQQLVCLTGRQSTGGLIVSNSNVDRSLASRLNAGPRQSQVPRGGGPRSKLGVGGVPSRCERFLQSAFENRLQLPRNPSSVSSAGLGELWEPWPPIPRPSAVRSRSLCSAIAISPT